MSEINQCVLTGQVIAIDPIRYTPAGVLRCRIWVEHRSRQLENNHPQEVMAKIAVQLVGDHWTATIKQLQPGAQLRIQGYLMASGVSYEAAERVQLQAVQLEVTHLGLPKG